MYDANEKMSALTESIRLIERIKDEIAGMGFTTLEFDLMDMMRDFDEERRDLDEECRREDEEERAAEEREYYAAVI